MRELTIKREKVSTCSRAAVEIYITSPEAAELTIEGVPCRKLGEVKNGEAEIFSIGGDEATVYAVVADSAKDFVCRSYELEAGEENVNLCGFVNKEDGAAVFCFGTASVPTGEKKSLKGVFSLAAFIAIGAVLGWFIGNLVFNGFPAPAQTFTQNGYSIKLNEDFVDTGVEAYHASYESEDVAVFSSMQPYEELGGKEAYSLQEYAQMMVDDNQLANAAVAEKRGVTYFEYEYGSGIFSYHYTVAVHEGSEGYWLTYFAVDTEDYKDYKNDIFKWARSVQVP